MRKTRLLLFILLIQVSVGIRAQDNILTTEGLGPVKLGASLDNIPDTYPGLYASKGMERDETVFFDENKQEVFRAFVGEDKIVNLIAVVSPNILTPEGAHVGMKKADKGVRIEVADGVVKVDLSVNVKYGYSIPEMGRKVQEKVKGAIENMTGLSVADVNIRIAGIEMGPGKAS